MEQEKKNGITDDLREIVEYMQNERILRMQTRNLEIELHPTAFSKNAPASSDDKKDPRFEMSQEEKMARAKSYFNEMIGGL